MWIWGFERLWRDQLYDSCKSLLDVKLYLCLLAGEQQGDREEEAKTGHRDQAGSKDGKPAKDKTQHKD